MRELCEKIGIKRLYMSAFDEIYVCAERSKAL